ncbi:hypothetical protein GQ457_16G018210 [Hibiscus cannabinus]
MIQDQRIEENLEDIKLDQRRRIKGIYRGYLLDVTDIFRRLVRKFPSVLDRHLSNPVQIASFRNVGLTLTLVSNGGGIEMHF